MKEGIEGWHSDPVHLGLDPRKVNKLVERAAQEVESGVLPSVQIAVARKGKLAILESFGEASSDPPWGAGTCRARAGRGDSRRHGARARPRLAGALARTPPARSCRRGLYRPHQKSPGDNRCLLENLLSIIKKVPRMLRRITAIWPNLLERSNEAEQDPNQYELIDEN